MRLTSGKTSECAGENIAAVAFHNWWQPQRPLSKTLIITNSSSGSALIITHTSEMHFCLTIAEAVLDTSLAQAAIVENVGHVSLTFQPEIYATAKTFKWVFL